MEQQLSQSREKFKKVGRVLGELQDQIDSKTAQIGRMKGLSQSNLSLVSIGKY